MSANPQPGSSYVMGLKETMIHLGEPPFQPAIFRIGEFSVSIGVVRIRGNGTPGTVVERSGAIHSEDGDVPCTVGTSDMFVTLRPHEAFVHVEELEIELGLPEDAHIGEVLRYRFEGCKLTWCDWGVKEDHINTIVDPPDNNGRPEMLIPASDTL
ncbi:hypothetical protein AAWM_11150 [Aspergillus awamori]|uniref:Uncharacterized protein n=1 Tax=Aspergillus awamori TaxID=105351 RepID=A0A401L9X9_ASPAW|nr:hypothetical protein AAWM_11150 [Aspergillus awamori]